MWKKYQPDSGMSIGQILSFLSFFNQTKNFRKLAVFHGTESVLVPQLKNNDFTAKTQSSRSHFAK